LWEIEDGCFAGIIAEDPAYDSSLLTEPPPPRQDLLFTDEDKKKQLERLLRSSKPEDLQVIIVVCRLGIILCYVHDALTVFAGIVAPTGAWACQDFNCC